MRLTLTFALIAGCSGNREQTFDRGLDVFTVPGSAPSCVLWSIARGGPRRTGAAHVR